MLMLRKSLLSLDRSCFKWLILLALNVDLFIVPMIFLGSQVHEVKRT